MHKIFITRGLVLGKRTAGEANTIALVLTEDLGLVRGRAQSARLERSKLRYGLEPFTEARFSLVRGRHEWRLIGSCELSHDCIAPTTPGRASGRARAGRIAKLLMRLMPGEEPVPGLFGEVVEGLRVLARAQEEELADTIECVLVLRILSRLGYLPHNETLKPFIERDFFSLELASEAAASRKILIQAINESLKATGL